jgi:hypothetical protein
MDNTDPALSHDAPILHLLSLRHNPLLKDMSTDELTAHLARIKSLVQSPPSLTAELKKEAAGRTKSPTKAAARKNILDNL